MSLSLTKTEQHYAQIEKESLAIVFACERFNHYIHGQKQTTIHTDHRPLVPIFRKPIYNVPKWLQRILLRLQKYALIMMYCLGKEMLSRAYIHDHTQLPREDYQTFQVHRENRLFKETEDIEPAKHVRLSEKGLSTLREATRNNNTLTELAKVIHQGWPEHKQDVQPSIRT